MAHEISGLPAPDTFKEPQDTTDEWSPRKVFATRSNKALARTILWYTIIRNTTVLDPGVLHEL